MINLHDKNLPDPVGIEPAASLSPLEHNAMEPLRPAGKEFKSPNIVDITKTRLYNFDPLKPHFYIVKLGLTGVYIIFLISAQSIDCGYSLELPL